MRDIKGKMIPAWARYIKNISSSLAEQTDSNNQTIAFALYVPEEATVVLTPIENSASISMTLGAGYHPIACKSVTSTTVAIQALFAYNFED